MALELLQRHGDAVQEYLAGALRRLVQAPPRLVQAIEYSLLAGGKRLRPALVLETFAACGGGESRRTSAIVAAGAIELIHTFSLVHDDLPAMDNDDLRRGRPTSHKVFGEAMAILAGDAMTTLAFELIAADVDPALCAPLSLELARASGPIGMIGGQVLDMEGEHRQLALEELMRLHSLKTGALLTAACRLGALCAGASAQALDCAAAFGREIGLAFQIVDDVLDVTSTPEQMGKATGKDAARGKNTYPALLGLEPSRQQADARLAAALDALKRLGPGAGGLEAMARFVVQRLT